MTVVAAITLSPHALAGSHDVGEWLIEQGHAIAAYGDKYRHIEAEAQRAERGIWVHATGIDPRSWLKPCPE